MKKRAALIERVRQLRAWLEACPPGDRMLRLSLLLVELAVAYAKLVDSNNIFTSHPSPNQARL